MNEVGELVTVAVPAAELPCSELNRWVRTIGDANAIPEEWETAPALEAEWPPQAATATGTIIVNSSRLYIFRRVPVSEAEARQPAYGCGLRSLSSLGTVGGCGDR